MNFNLAVSIIVPVYNMEKYLDEGIQSVLNQTLQNIELILVNDGSTDKSLKICENYVAEDPRVKLINQNNSGVSIARNNGLNIAKGEYIFFMDSDDSIESDFLESSYQIAIKNNSDIVIIGEYFCKKLDKVTALPTWAQFIKSDFLNFNSDIRFPENLQPCEDGLFSHQLLSLTKSVSINPTGIYNYRQHENQNHIKIHENYDSVIKQIPRWFDILMDFYSRKALLKSHALHLALFLEHEPFELRYLTFNLSNEQKSFLHQTIKKFYAQNIASNITTHEILLLGMPFRMFLEANNFKIFDRYYRNYKRKKRIKLILINLIPIKKIRKEFRILINEKYKII